MEPVPSVCPSVSALMAEPFDELTQNFVEALTLISDEFEGQGHRSKVKLARLKNVISEVSGGLIFVHSVIIRRHLTSHHDFTSSDVTP